MFHSDDSGLGIDGTIPSEIFRLPSLEGTLKFILHPCAQDSTDIILQLFLLFPSAVLTFDGPANLRGTIPDSIGDAESLTSLDL